MEKLTEEQHNMAIGSIVTSAANADLVLFNTFWRISGTALHAASSIYYCIEAMPVRARIVTKVASYQCNYDQRKLVKKVVDAATKANELRKLVAHSSRIDYQGQVLSANPKNIKNPATAITRKAFAKSIEDAIANLRRAEAAHKSLCESLGVSPQLQIAHDTD